MGYVAPAADPQLLQSGLPAGPLTPAWGDGVLTPVAVAAPDVHAVAAPAVTYAGYALPAVKPVEVKVEKVEPVEVKAPVVTYAAAPALAHPVHYAAPLAAVH